MINKLESVARLMLLLIWLIYAMPLAAAGFIVGWIIGPFYNGMKLGMSFIGEQDKKGECCCGKCRQEEASHSSDRDDSIRDC